MPDTEQNLSAKRVAVGGSSADNISMKAGRFAHIELAGVFLFTLNASLLASLKEHVEWVLDFLESAAIKV